MTPEPRVWIGCLAAYNAGTLHGEWVDVPDDADELWQEIRRVLAASPEPRAEEWFFADNEGFDPWKPGEWPDVPKLVFAARGIREHGAPFAGWLDNDPSVLTDADDYQTLEEAFREQYRGAYDSEEDYARSFVEDCGLPGVGYLYPERSVYSTAEPPRWSEVLSSLDCLLDWEAITRSVLEGSFTIEDGGTVHVFEER